tara:strand:- start:359 stop:817 length:459 start_codon:yes stop_codon:yes gene_type:complete
MNTNTNTLKADLKHGLNAEMVRKERMDQMFGTLTKTKNKFNSFDFKNQRFYVEHKERSCRYGKYDSLFFDYIKYERYIELKKKEPDKRFIIVWTCMNQSYYWEFTEVDEDENGDAVFYTDTQLMDRRRGNGFQPQSLVYVFNEHIRPLAEFK